MTAYDFQSGWVLNKKAQAGSPDAKAPYVDNGTDLLKPERYFDPAFKKAEWEKMWTRSWLVAGRVSDIPNDGDFLRFDVGTESIIIVRTSSGQIKAFYNVCQHRGARIVNSDFGNARKFRCLYHNWAWTIDGEIDQVTDREVFREEVLSGSLDLPQIRCDSWGGFVFINMCEEAPPLLEYLDVLPEHLAPYRIEDMVVVKDAQVEWPVNWKTALDAFTESYHVHVVHPEILGIFDDYVQQWDIYENGINRMLMKFGTPSPRFPDQESINPGLAIMLKEAGVEATGFEGSATDVRPFIQQSKREEKAPMTLAPDGFTDNQLTDDWNYLAFPNVTFNAHPEGLLVQRFRPHPSDPEKMIYDITVLAHPIADPEAVLPAYMGVPAGVDLSGKERPERQYLTYLDGGMGPVLEQDAAMVPFVQKGIRSRGYKGARLSEQEQRVRHYHREIDRYIAGEKW